MEKELIENWAKRFGERDDAWSCVLLEKSIGDCFGKIILQYKKDREKLLYIWEHELYLLAFETFENKDWHVHSAYSINGNYYLIISHKKVKELIYYATFEKESDIFFKTEGKSYRFNVEAKKLEKEKVVGNLSDKELRKLEKIEKKENLETKKKLIDFFEKWLLNKSRMRIILSLEKASIQKSF